MIGAGYLSAQMPSLLEYDGHLTENITGNRKIGVRLYNASTNGTILYTENVGTVIVTRGQFYFQYGQSGTAGNSTTPTTIAAALTGSQQWLALTINGTEQSPRERLIAVPHALLKTKQCDNEQMLTRNMSTSCGNVTTLTTQVSGQSINASSSMGTVNVKSLEVKIIGSDGNHIPSSEAAIIFQSGEYQRGTRASGCILFEAFAGQARIFLAAPGYEAESRYISNTETSTFTLKPSSTKDSIIIYGRGRLPEKGGDINPGVGTSNELGIFGLGGIVLLDGTQPAKHLMFRLKSPILAQDIQGKKFEICVIDISQRNSKNRGVSLVEYTK